MSVRKCFVTGLAAHRVWKDEKGNKQYICDEIYNGGVKLYEKYMAEDPNLTLENAIDSVISNLWYLKAKEAGKIKPPSLLDKIRLWKN